MVEFVDKGELGARAGDTQDAKVTAIEPQNILENIRGGGVFLVAFSPPLVRRFFDSPSASFEHRMALPTSLEETQRHGWRPLNSSRLPTQGMPVLVTERGLQDSILKSKESLLHW